LHKGNALGALTVLDKGLTGDAEMFKGLIDEIQIQQVVMNLIRNPIDAMHKTPIWHNALTVSAQIRQGVQAEAVAINACKWISEGETRQVSNACFSTKKWGVKLPIIRSAHRSWKPTVKNSGRSQTKVAV